MIPINFSAYAMNQIVEKAEQPSSFVIENQQFPESFDPRGYLDFPVQSQGERNLCWAFSSLGSIESYLLRKGIEQKLSVLYMDYLTAENANGIYAQNIHAYPRSAGGVGYEYMSLYSAMRWLGPVAEEEMPYVSVLDKRAVALNELVKTPVVHVQGMVVLPPLEQDDHELQLYQKIQKVKEHLWNNGSLSYSWNISDLDSGIVNKEHQAYYVPEYLAKAEVNHTSLIVGWDDYYPKENFTLRPNRDGAFIVKNSWGPYWGDEGYYYLSYEDYYFAYSALYGVDQVEENDNYDHQYSHTDFYGDYSLNFYREHCYIANVFTAPKQEEVLKAVAISTRQYDTPYEIYVNVNNDSINQLNQLVKVASGIKRNPGIETIVLEEALPIQAEENFAIVVKYTKPKGVEEGAVAIESENISQHVRVNEGESFISLYTNEDNLSFESCKEFNVYIHAYTDNVGPKVVQSTAEPETTFVNFSSKSIDFMRPQTNGSVPH
ncbi:hypothetical protein FACS189418_9050 [Clostridia bacterium]|nr:hypothetical protein FACS189418_9050 [Clostridia bacterium]